MIRGFGIDSVEVERMKKIVEKGDIVVITAGIPISTVGSTNLIKAQVID